MANRSHAVSALAALGDPMRREIFEQLAKKPSPVGELSARLPVTRSAVSQHLRVLKEAGLVTDTAEGTRRIYRLDPRGIGAVRDWLDRHWSTALDAFQTWSDAQDEDEENDEAK